MGTGDEKAAVSLSEVYLLDVVLAIILATLVVFFLCGSIRLARAGGTLLYRAGSVLGRATYAVLDFFSKLYQAALGILIATVVAVSLYFYFTTNEQRQHVHQAVESASPVTSGLVRQALEHNGTQYAVEHLRHLAKTYFTLQ